MSAPIWRILLNGGGDFVGCKRSGLRWIIWKLRGQNHLAKERKIDVLNKRNGRCRYHERGPDSFICGLRCCRHYYKVSISRRTALGVTTFLPDEDQNLQSKKFLLEELLVLMAGEQQKNFL